MHNYDDEKKLELQVQLQPEENRKAMKIVVWSQLNSKNKGSMRFWNEINKRISNFDDNYDELNKLFCVLERQNEEKEDKEEKQKLKERERQAIKNCKFLSTTINDQRIKKIYDTLTTVEIEYVKIKEWILKMDIEKLSLDEIDKYILILPQFDEIEKMNKKIDNGNGQYNTEKFESILDEWFYLYHDIPTIHVQLELWQFKIMYHKCGLYFEKQIDLLQASYYRIVGSVIGIISNRYPI